MLPDQATQLLTAFVDGELGQRQRKAALRLLQRSSEARELLCQLQENAHKLKQLPRRKVEPSLVDEVLQAIAEQKAQPKPPAPKYGRRRRWMPYVAASLAASILIGVVGLLYWKSMGELGNKTITPVANIDKKQEPMPTPEPQPAPPKLPNRLLANLVEGTFREFGQPVPPDPVFTARFADLQSDKGPKFADLTRQIDRDPAVQLDITVKNNKDALARLKDVLKDRGITLVTDQSAAKTLAGKNQTKVEYLVYSENLSRDEVAKLMGELSQSYVVPGTTNQKTVETPYKKVTVAPIAKDDKQKVTKLLGVDATAEPKGNADAKRLAVVLPTSAGARPSAEVRQFVDQRRPPQAGMVQVLIKIRQE